MLRDHAEDDDHREGVHRNIRARASGSSAGARPRARGEEIQSSAAPSSAARAPARQPQKKLVSRMAGMKVRNGKPPQMTGEQEAGEQRERRPSPARTQAGDAVVAQLRGALVEFPGSIGSACTGHPSAATDAFGRSAGAGRRAEAGRQAGGSASRIDREGHDVLEHVLDIPAGFAVRNVLDPGIRIDRLRRQPACHGTGPGVVSGKAKIQLMAVAVEQLVHIGRAQRDTATAGSNRLVPARDAADASAWRPRSAVAGCICMRPRASARDTASFRNRLSWRMIGEDPVGRHLGRACSRRAIDRLRRDAGSAAAHRPSCRPARAWRSPRRTIPNAMRDAPPEPSREGARRASAAFHSARRIVGQVAVEERMSADQARDRRRASPAATHRRVRDGY